MTPNRQVCVTELAPGFVSPVPCRLRAWSVTELAPGFVSTVPCRLRVHARMHGRDHTHTHTHKKKFCSECGAESAPAGQRMPAAGRDLAWAARTGSGPMWMCGDIFAAARRGRGRLLTTGRLSCRHPVVVCAGRGRGVAVAGRAVAWACFGRGAAICVRVSSSVNHL